MVSLGSLADFLISKRIVSNLTSQKLFSAICSFGPAIALAWLSLGSCNLLNVVAMFCLCVGFHGASFSGFSVSQTIRVFFFHEYFLIALIFLKAKCLRLKSKLCIIALWDSQHCSWYHWIYSANDHWISHQWQCMYVTINFYISCVSDDITFIDKCPIVLQRATIPKAN